MALRQRRRRRIQRRERIIRPRFAIADMCEVEIVARYRFSVATIVLLVDLLRNDLERPTRRSRAVPVELQLLVALRFFATGAFYRVIGDTVGLSANTVMRCVHAVATSIANLAREYIKFPSGDVARRTQQKFYSLCRFPNVVGAIDCTHIRIQAPLHNEADFVNRKGYHSLNVQMTCDTNFIITNCTVKWPGAVHDSRIFRDSRLCHKFERGEFQGIMLGDSGYPCRKFLMTPFTVVRDNRQQRYNNSLCRGRVVIEQTFGILKRRFSCLSTGLRMSPNKAATVTAACAVLHNIAILQKEDIGHTDELDPDGQANNDVDAGNIDGAAVRQQICTTHF